MHVHSNFPKHTRRNPASFEPIIVSAVFLPVVWPLAAVPTSTLPMSTDVDPSVSNRQISLLDSRGSLIDIPDSGMLVLGRQNMPLTTALTASKVSRSAHFCLADLSNNGMSAAHGSVSHCPDTSGLNVRLVLAPRPRVLDAK